LGKTAALFAFHIHNVSITLASAANAVLFRGIGCIPVFVFLFSLLLIFCGHFEEWRAISLAGRGIGWTMLDCCVSISEISKVVYITW
jgi:hypothetical protein